MTSVVVARRRFFSTCPPKASSFSTCFTTCLSPAVYLLFSLPPSSLFLLSHRPRFFASFSSFFYVAARMRGRSGPHNNETEIVHGIYIPPPQLDAAPRARRDTSCYSSRPNPRTRARERATVENILSLFNLIARRRARCIRMIFISVARARDKRARYTKAARCVATAGPVSRN